MTNATLTPIETIAPAYVVGDTVRFNGRTGTICRVYLASGVPLWYGTRRLIHTHCYEIARNDGVQTWGWVDAELEKMAIRISWLKTHYVHSPLTTEYMVAKLLHL